MKYIMLFVLCLSMLTTGCMKDGKDGSTGLTGPAGQDATLEVREWSGDIGPVNAYTVPITWNSGEEVLVIAEVKLYGPDGSRGWTPISTLWVYEGGSDIYQTTCAVYESQRKVKLWFAHGTYRVTMYVLSQ